MISLKFDDEWEKLPEVYKTRFREILEERGLTEGFGQLPDEQKSQMLKIIKDFLETMAGAETPPQSGP